MSNQTLRLISIGKDKDRVIKVIRNSLGIGYIEGKAKIISLPCDILTAESWKVKALSQMLIAAGCKVEIVNNNILPEEKAKQQEEGDKHGNVLYENMSADDLMTLAWDNDPDACIELSVRYRTGTDDFEKDEEEADYWLKQGNVYRDLTAKHSPQSEVNQLTANKIVTTTFVANSTNWFGQANDSDCCYRKISDSIKSSVRQYFGIDVNEDIIFFRDTSFWNDRNQGLVITDKAIYCIADNDKPDEKIYLPWEILKKVVYRDLVLYFYGNGGDDDYCPIHVTYFVKTSNEDKQSMLGQQIANLLNSVCRNYTPPADAVDEAYKQYNKLIEDGKNEEAFKFALNAYNTISGADSFCIQIVQGYRAAGNTKVALEYCEKGLAVAETGSPLYVLCMYLKESIYALELGDPHKAREYAFLTAKYANDETLNGVLIKEDAQRDFEKYDEKYVNEFLNQSYQERKVLMPVKKYVDLSQTHISVIDINHLPEIHFPMGHPKANQLYVGHPFLADKYITFENYQLELIEDRVREFCWIAQCMGATEITIDAENSTQSNITRNASQNISGNGKFNGVGAQASYNKNKSNSLIEEIRQVISFHQSFKPMKKPYLPDKLVWYMHEPSWQRLCEQRMNGGLVQHEERIETRKSQVVGNDELMEIKAEMQYLMSEANFGWNNSLDEKFSQQENAVLAIKVSFAPIETLGNDEAIPLSISPQTSVFTKNEQEYIDCFKEFLEDDKEISVKERRILNRLRISLGLTEERVNELEGFLLPQLTDDEKEYLEMYHEYKKEGDITEKKRRRLEKFAVALRISPDRITELENM